MKNFLKASFAVGVALVALSASSQAQTVAVNGLGSSAMFLELGLAASSATTASPAGLGATCLWTENTNTVVATDATVTPSAQDKGSAFVAWTPGTGSCAAPVSPTIYAYLQTDSVVGNRCLFNSCTIAYPTTNPVSANIILSTGEVPLPTTIATTLNGAAINVAGTDIRPEDAEFAITRALAPCNTAVGSPQYLGLGYANGGTIDSYFTGSTFNVVNFSLPTTYAVTPLGAVPIVVVVNSSSATTDFNVSGITNLTHQVLAGYLDGTNSYTNQALTTNPTATGSAVTTIIREPLSGTYNTMEYNIPNTSNTSTTNGVPLGLKTSQDVGLNQPAAQKNCNGTVPLSNPMHIGTPSGGFRDRAIGTGQELGEFTAPTAGKITTPAVLGYAFWSLGNFKGFNTTASQFARYLTVDGFDPLLNASTPYSTYNGKLPLPGSAEIANVNLATTANGSYPIWSMLRLVNKGTTPLAVTELATASQNFVPTGTTAARPDFVQALNLSAVHSHFIPPAGTIQPTTAANGKGSDSASKCTSPELGGDVGGVVYALTADSSYCAQHGPTGQTGQRK